MFFLLIEMVYVVTSGSDYTVFFCATIKSVFVMFQIWNGEQQFHERVSLPQN